MVADPWPRSGSSFGGVHRKGAVPGGVECAEAGALVSRAVASSAMSAVRPARRRVLPMTPPQGDVADKRDEDTPVILDREGAQAVSASLGPSTARRWPSPLLCAQ